MTNPNNKRTKQLAQRGGVGILVLAVLILAINFFASQRGQPLPQELTDAAETVVQESLNQAAPSAAPATSDTPQAQATPSATPATSDTPQAQATRSTPAMDDLPWQDADTDFDYYVLALSWQPAFCETRPDKPECQTQTEVRYDAKNFALHGLWPNRHDDPNHNFGYCEVSNQVVNQSRDGDWCDMPQLILSDEVWEDLTTYMPGTESCLENHEWYKHGSCAGMSADAYFALSNALTESFSRTDFNRYVAAEIGQTVRRGDLLNAFATEFGAGSDTFLSLRCSKVDGRSLLSEIQIALRPDLGHVDDFAGLFPTDHVNPNGSCPAEFVIDGAGL